MNRFGRFIAILLAICVAVPSNAVYAAEAAIEGLAAADTSATNVVIDDEQVSNEQTTGENSAGPETTAEAAKPIEPAETAATEASDVLKEQLVEAEAAVTFAADNDADEYGTVIAGSGVATIHVRVAVDGVWKYAGADGKLYDSADAEGYNALTSTHEANRAGGDRVIIGQTSLAKALASVGFTTDEFKRADQSDSADWGNWIFGYTDAGGPDIYNDVTPQKVTGYGWYAFTKGYQWVAMDSAGKKALDLYYMPANRNDGAFNRPSSFFGETSKSASDEQLLADNSFHTVTFLDPDSLIYASAADLPATTYVNTNIATARRQVTVKKPKTTAKWVVTGADVSSITDNGDDTLTYLLANVTGAVTFTAAPRPPGQVTIVYRAEMTDADRTQLGNAAAGNQVICGNTTIEDAATKTINVEPAESADGHTVLSPDSDIATVYWTQNSSCKFIYSFLGWKVEGSDTIYTAGDQISLADLDVLADASGTVTFKSVWQGVDNNTSNPHIRSVNFYLNLACEILDVTGNSGSQPKDEFTQSIYSTRVSGTDTFGGGNFVLLDSNSSDNAYEVDAKIRNSANVSGGIFPPSSWTNYTDPDGVRLEKFPTDEEVLAAVRASSSVIKIDGEDIPKENITSANFTVRWYVLKYEVTDGWHIDGVLVAKKARLVVTKTFEGETDAKAAFAEAHGYSSLAEYDATSDFHIDVTHKATVDGSTMDVTDYQLLLVPDSDLTHTDATDRRYGYTSYDAATDTYTWEIETRQSREYTVKENNYYLDTNSWNNLTWYEVHNSSSTYNTDGWTEYDAYTGASVKVLAAAYPTDVPSTSWQTVGFRNAYVHKGTLAVFKNDKTTGAAMGDVAFTVEQQGSGGATALYCKKDATTGKLTNEYTTDSTVLSQYPGKYEKVDNGQATTNANGVFYLALAAPDESSDVTATYKLSEVKDTVKGYEGPDFITFTMTYKNGIAAGDLSWEGGSSDVNWAQTGENKFILNIYNRSSSYTSVTACKEWAEGTTDAKQVTVELWRAYGNVKEKVPDTGADGARILQDVNGKYVSNEQVLSAINNWTFSWGNLPLFINNQQVTYSLREIWIGNPTASDSVAYDASADPEDGYADYAVTTENAIYVDGDTVPTWSGGTDPRTLYPHEDPTWQVADGTTAYAKHALLMIDNAGVKGVISFTKKDRAGLDGKPLAGATFTLYSDAACTTEIESVTTGANGVAAFAKQPAGTYYFKETKAPAGYSFDAAGIYQAVVSNGTPVITKVGDATQTAVTSVYNKFGAGFNVKKIGDGSIDTAAGVSGATFTLTKADGTGDWATPQTRVTGSNGYLSFTGIDQGTYTLTEVTSPAGYEAVEAPTLTFTVETDEETGKTTFSLADESVIDPDGKTFVAWKDDSTDSNIAYTLTVRNTPLKQLPTTGGEGLLGIIAAGSGLMLAAAYAWLRRPQIKEV
ncbi:SpaA isopeptide-forming pilin-related protein [Paratractidigestivibacter sp.]|uniref:SpaA isopeptide-forming pilin-related protein n=2 Tax=Paratractidigestivibacter sp. TaxID=2847316 RepID=UPI002AC96C38|nr:SpaA isopeptide-forming pilin-related protein [Paratractidigestivibacter sp.]